MVSLTLFMSVMFGATLTLMVPAEDAMFLGTTFVIFGAGQLFFHRSFARRSYARALKWPEYASFYEKLGVNGLTEVFLCFYGMQVVDGILLMTKSILFHK